MHVGRGVCFELILLHDFVCFFNPRSRRGQRVTVVRLSVCLSVCLSVISESPHLAAMALHLQHG